MWLSDVVKLKSSHWTTRRKAAFDLGSFDLKHNWLVIQALNQALLTDTNLDVRMNAAKSLGLVGDSRAVKALTKALSTDKDWSIREYAATALGNIRDERAVEPLLAALRDKDHHVKAAAARALVALHVDLERIKSSEDQDFVRLTLEAEKREKERKEEAQRQEREREEEARRRKRERLEENRGVLILETYWGNDQDGTTYKRCATCGSQPQYSMSVYAPSTDHLYRVGNHCPKCGTLFTKEKHIDHN